MSSDFGSRTGPPLGPEEIALHGGSMTAVWRVGETVRRATGRWTPAVHALLDHLERAGFDGAPRALGIDTAGREILTYLSGASDWPKNDDAVLAVGRLLRRYHDAVATFVPAPGMPWRIDRPLGPGEIVCHNDLQPANTVFRDGEPVAFIDWDLAGPAPAIFDLARAAWDFIPLRSDRFCLHMGFKTPLPRARRLRLLCDGYGLHDCPEVLSALHELQHQDLDGIQRLGRAGVSPFAHFLDGGEDQYVQADIDWLAANRRALSS
jgi:Phosphotransferase enzyme family